MHTDYTYVINQGLQSRVVETPFFTGSLWLTKVLYNGAGVTEPPSDPVSVLGPLVEMEQISAPRSYQGVLRRKDRNLLCLARYAGSLKKKRSLFVNLFSPRPHTQFFVGLQFAQYYAVHKTLDVMNMFSSNQSTCIE